MPIKFFAGFSRILVFFALLLICCLANAGPREQATRIHERIAGVPPSAAVLDQMADLIQNGPGSTLENAKQAAYIAMDNPDFYRTTLKNFATSWTNRDQDVFAPLNDFTATIIGMVRDDVDFRDVLSANLIYTGSGAGIPPYSTTNNDHYAALEKLGVDLKSNLQRHDQTSLTGIPAEATAGVITTRAAAKAFFINGTNRAMFRFTFMNFLCHDLPELMDVTRSPDRIRQDVTRSPGGDSRLFRNTCLGCHAGMDPMTQAFAYYDYVHDATGDPDGLSGHIAYNGAGMIDPTTGSRVVHKYHINQNNFPLGYVTQNDDWANYWRAGPNQDLGWDPNLPGKGEGAKSLGKELSHSEAFAECQATKVFRVICLRPPVDGNDRSEVASMVSSLKGSGFKLKQSFADAAAYCMGN